MNAILLCLCMLIMFAQASMLDLKSERGFARKMINLHDNTSIVHNTGKPTSKRDDPVRD